MKNHHLSLDRDEGGGINTRIRRFDIFFERYPKLHCVDGIVGLHRFKKELISNVFSGSPSYSAVNPVIETIANPIGGQGMYSVDLVDLQSLVPTEIYSESRASDLSSSIRHAGMWTVPVLCLKDANAVLDGHHRCAAARLLKLKRIPVVFVSADDPRVSLKAWRENETVSFDLIIQFVASGELLPFKTTRFEISGGAPQTSIPLSRLIS